MLHWKNRLYAGAIHLAISLSVAALAAYLVFGIWYPSPYPELSGGRELFLLVIAVDVVIGPLITLVIFNRTKTALLHKSAIGQGIPNPKKIYAAATVWGVPRSVN